MLNHPRKILLIIASCITLIACHKPPILDKSLALSILNDPQNLSGYTINMAINNPHARGKNASGWNCADKQALIDADLVSCNTAGRSGVYLEFSDEGKKLITGSPWGDETLRKVHVIAVTQAIQKINTIEMIDKTHATVSYDQIYSEHTPFSNDALKRQIPLNLSHVGQANFVLIDDEWVIQKPAIPAIDE